MDSLEAAGLTHNEAKIYSYLLKSEKSNITEIAKKTGVHRRNVYDVIMRLIDKGLVSVMVEEKSRVYYANNPKQLSALIEERKKAIDQGIPYLVKTFEKNTERKSTQFLYGKQGIKTVLEDQIRIEKEVLVIGGATKTTEILKFFMPKYDLLRREKKIPLKIIYSGKNFIPPKKQPLITYKHFPKGIGGEVAINIYGTNVALLLWSQENPFAILIRDKDVSESFKDYFEYIWKTI